jgi:hypothetical protein
MKHLLTSALLHGYTSGLSLHVSGWNMFLQFYEITSFQYSLLPYRFSNHLIPDILN